jgi:hypothetical protein
VIQSAAATENTLAKTHVHVHWSFVSVPVMPSDCDIQILGERLKSIREDIEQRELFDQVWSEALMKAERMISQVNTDRQGIRARSRMHQEARRDIESGIAQVTDIQSSITHLKLRGKTRFNGSTSTTQLMRTFKDITMAITAFETDVLCAASLDVATPARETL